jgi:hypothetical protein
MKNQLLWAIGITFIVTLAIGIVIGRHLPRGHYEVKELSFYTSAANNLVVFHMVKYDMETGKAWIWSNAGLDSDQWNLIRTNYRDQ